MNTQNKVAVDPKINGTLVIKISGVVAAFSYHNQVRAVIPLAQDSYPFSFAPNPAGGGDAYYLFGHKPPVYVNKQVVAAHSSDVCEVIIIPPGKDMALSE